MIRKVKQLFASCVVILGVLALSATADAATKKPVKHRTKHTTSAASSTTSTAKKKSRKKATARKSTTKKSTTTAKRKPSTKPH